MNKANDNDFLEFTLKWFKELGYKAISVFPRTGNIVAIRKEPQEMMIGNDDQFLYKMNEKEQKFFSEHKEYCYTWLLTERKNK